MSPEQFCYWLQGHCELNKHTHKLPDPVQWQMIIDHLDTVFKKETQAIEIFHDFMKTQPREMVTAAPCLPEPPLKIIC